MVLSTLLREKINTDPITAVEAWRARSKRVLELESSADRALLCGFLADRVAYAFAGGYEAALSNLVAGKLDQARARRATSLCITEEGGGHPRAIKTALGEGTHGTLVLNGRKQWATGAQTADLLLVAASVGFDDAGRNKLVLVAVDARAPGVTWSAMPQTPFAPELPHARVELDHVRVSPGDVLVGDGYDVYIKPFRTIEDSHVFLALIGYLIRSARLYEESRSVIEELCAAATALSAITRASATAPETHVALAGALAWGKALMDRVSFENAPDDVRERWERDRALSLVAERARAERRNRAWTTIGTGEPQTTPLGGSAR
ncbi:MAG: acyl-CoA dehydrogenase family protein [Polyangiaceae bacterium]|nr:acyl-CoA dehydrogenase family protein [Polyangiaceae bacterium]